MQDWRDSIQTNANILMNETLGPKKSLDKDQKLDKVQPLLHSHYLDCPVLF
jgi:hypothetical protein